MAESPGVIIAQDFVVPGTIDLSGYLDYMNRPEAIKTNSMESVLDGYIEYMRNPEKSTGLFSEKTEALSTDDLKKIKEIFEIARKNESILWRPVISFDNQWLEDNHLYDEGKNWLDEEKIKLYTKSAVNALLKDEQLENAVWTAAIHHNTDNIHIHIAIVEPVPMRQKQLMPDGSYQYRGKFKLKSIEHCKSVMVNKIISQQAENEKINNIIRKKIIDSKKEYSLLNDSRFTQDFLKLYKNMPEDRRTWKYNMQAMQKFQKDIDQLSERYIELNHHDEYVNLKQLLYLQEQKYIKAYGGGENNYMQNKIDELHVRLGNVILKEMLEYDKSVKKNEAINVNKISDYQKNYQVDDKRIEHLEDLSNGGNYHAQYALGKILLEKGLAEDRKDICDEGLKYIESSVNVGSLHMNYIVGFCLYDEGVRTNTHEYVEKGISYLEKAADIGDEHAQSIVGKYYLHLGVTSNTQENIKKGTAYLEKAAQQEDENAKWTLQNHYTERDNKSGTLNESTDKDVLNKEGVRNNTREYTDKNIEHFEKAAQQGNTNAQYLVGKYYLNEGVRSNTKGNINKGIKYLKIAAEKEYGRAQYVLGKYYVENAGANKIKIGLTYMQKAKNNGFVPADSYLKWLERNNVKNLQVVSNLMKALKSGLKDEYEHFKLQREYEAMIEKKLQEKEENLEYEE